MSKKKYKEPKHVLANQFWLEGDSKVKLEKLSDKIIDLIFKKFGQDVGVMVGQFVPEGPARERNAAERALDRLSEPVPKPWGKNQAHTHAYAAAIRHARRVINEELTKHHGL